MQQPVWLPNYVPSTFDSPKVAKARLPHPTNGIARTQTVAFFVSGGAIIADRLVTFYSAVEPMFIR